MEELIKEFEGLLAKITEYANTNRNTMDARDVLLIAGLYTLMACYLVNDVKTLSNIRELTDSAIKNLSNKAKARDN